MSVVSLQLPNLQRAHDAVLLFPSGVRAEGGLALVSPGAFTLSQIYPRLDAVGLMQDCAQLSSRSNDQELVSATRDQGKREDQGSLSHVVPHHPTIDSLFANLANRYSHQSGLNEVLPDCQWNDWQAPPQMQGSSRQRSRARSARRGAT